MKNKKLLCSVCFLFTFMSVLWGQNITVKGNVTSKTDGQPIIGASVVQNDSKSTGTITDLDGNFTLSVPANASLAISYIGYKEVIIAAKPSLKIVMEEDAKMIDEVVVTGYMAEKKASLTGSVAVVKMKEVADIPTGNVMSGLQGRVAGMNVTTDGKPGGGNTDTKLRGITTINNSSPLYVIDGVQTHDNVASIISSNDVESIQVLKDAASAAIYGAQAANGVIIITTKRAKEGDVKVSFDMSLTAQTFAGGIDMLDAYQWGDVYWQAYKNTFGTYPNSVVYGNGEKAQLQEYYFDQNGVKIKSGNTDWAKEIFGTALMQNYNLSLSKGFKDGNVALTLNYMNQDGTFAVIQTTNALIRV
ncbi:TonB-dependent receptor plug domain-containing protein [Bacteroides ovatus]|nr:TonB-dependent receptor plug domain-containing protein [Bacteroides ovatus]